LFNLIRNQGNVKTRDTAHDIRALLQPFYNYSTLDCTPTANQNYWVSWRVK